MSARPGHQDTTKLTAGCLPGVAERIQFSADPAAVALNSACRLLDGLSLSFLWICSPCACADHHALRHLGPIAGKGRREKEEEKGTRKKQRIEN